MLHRVAASLLVPRPKMLVNLLAEGDSITFGFGVTSAERYANVAQASIGGDVTHSNLATSGQTILQMIADGATIDALLDTSARTINVCSIMGGINDLTALATGTQVKALLQQWIRERFSAGWDRVVLLNLIGGAGAEFTAANEGVAELWAEDPRIVSCDAWGVEALQDRDDTELYQDGTHPTAAGHALIAPVYAAAVNRATYLHLEAA